MRQLANHGVLLLCTVSLISGCSPGKEAQKETQQALPQPPQSTTSGPPVSVGTKQPNANIATTFKLAPTPNSPPVKNLFTFKPLQQASSRQQLLDYFGRVYASCTELTLGGYGILCFSYDIGSGIYIGKAEIYLREDDSWLLSHALPDGKEPGGHLPDNGSAYYQFSPVGEDALQITVARVVAKDASPSEPGKSPQSPTYETVYQVMETLSLNALKEKARQHRSAH